MFADKPGLHTRMKAHQPDSLRTLALDVTPRCNMACPHCYAVTFEQVQPVELDVLATALDEAYHLGVYHYVLQGGEPIADPHRLEHILAAVHPEETYLNVVSNGWAMTRERIAWLKARHVDKVTFSLDSGLADEHDRSRGKGSYQRTMAAIDHVLESGLLCSISTVVTHESLYSAGFRLAYAYAKAKGIRIDIQIAEPVGRWDGRRELLITPEDAAYIKQLQQSCPTLPNGLRMVNRDIFSGPCDHCPAGVEFMAITADGQFLPCNFLQFSLGNIRDRSLGEMRDALIQNDWFQGKVDRCLCGEHQGFIDQFIMPHIDRPKPLDAWSVFGLAAATV
ncbi:MAG: radical SAM protein [Phycisphaeraceae bacterium]